MNILIYFREDFDYHVGAMDSELGQLKEFLNSSGIQLDANTLLGVRFLCDSFQCYKLKNLIHCFLPGPTIF